MPHIHEPIQRKTLVCVKNKPHAAQETTELPASAEAEAATAEAEPAPESHPRGASFVEETLHPSGWRIVLRRSIKAKKTSTWKEFFSPEPDSVLYRSLPKAKAAGFTP